MARRRYYKRYYKKNKWSIEQRPLLTTGADWLQVANNRINRQAVIEVVSATQDEGVRKVKNISVSLATKEGMSSFQPVYYWALVYAPEGYALNDLQGSGQLYQPSQYVINSGIINATEGKSRISSRLARNLNAGDGVYLIIGIATYNPDTSPSAAFDINGIVRYAICYN